MSLPRRGATKRKGGSAAIPKFPLRRMRLVLSAGLCGKRPTPVILLPPPAGRCNTFRAATPAHIPLDQIKNNAAAAAKGEKNYEKKASGETEQQKGLHPG